MDARATKRARTIVGTGAKAKSSVLSKFTEASFWERCAPDFQHVTSRLGRPNEREDEADAERGSGDLPCRTNFGTLLN